MEEQKYKMLVSGGGDGAGWAPIVYLAAVEKWAGTGTGRAGDA